MRILSFSSCFPSSAAPTEGIFVFDRLSAVAQRAGVAVVHPVAVCPVLGRVCGALPPAEFEMLGGLGVYHRRYRYVPGVLKRFDGWCYYRGLLDWVARRCRRDPPDLLDAHFAWPDGVGVSLVARRLGLPYAVTLRGTINPRYRKRCFRRRLADALRSAAAVISVSTPMARIAVELGAKPRRVYVIPNGVDSAAFGPADRGETRRRLGLPTDRPIVVCVGSLKPAKGQEDLIRAICLMRARPLLVLIGAAGGGAGYVRRLQALAQRLGLDGRVIFAGAVGRAAVAAYFNAADASVLPSRSEGCPNVVLESLACGTPVVAANVGGVGELLGGRDAGLIVRPRDPAAIAAALGQTLARQWPRDAIRSCVHGRSWQTVADEVLGVLRAAVRG